MSDIKKISLLALVLLAGCSSQASRMANCEAQGVSRDACYLAEQNRAAAINAAAEAQALQNAAKVNQYAQAAKSHVYKGYGVTFRMSSKNFAYLNDTACAIDEQTAQATVYSQGLNQVIVYKSGKVALMQEGRLVGYLK